MTDPQHGSSRAERLVWSTWGRWDQVPPGRLVGPASSVLLVGLVGAAVALSVRLPAEAVALAAVLAGLILLLSTLPVPGAPSVTRFNGLSAAMLVGTVTTQPLGPALLLGTLAPLWSARGLPASSAWRRHLRARSSLAAALAWGAGTVLAGGEGLAALFARSLVVTAVLLAAPVAVTAVRAAVRGRATVPPDTPEAPRRELAVQAMWCYGLAVVFGWAIGLAGPTLQRGTFATALIVMAVWSMRTARRLDAHEQRLVQLADENADTAAQLERLYRFTFASRQADREAVAQQLDGEVLQTLQASRALLTRDPDRAGAVYEHAMTAVRSVLDMLRSPTADVLGLRAGVEQEVARWAQPRAVGTDVTVDGALANLRGVPAQQAVRACRALLTGAPDPAGRVRVDVARAPERPRTLPGTHALVTVTMPTRQAGAPDEDAVARMAGGFDGPVEVTTDDSSWQAEALVPLGMLDGHDAPVHA